MKNKLLLIAVLTFFLTLSCSNKPEPTPTDEIQVLNPVAISKTNSTKVYVHYMPWFEDKTTNNGKWGQHWTMANKNPDNMDANGKREIASHYYPLIGPYASGDPDLIEYHLLLMKYAGIDGVLIDWYGTRDLYDYPANKKNTEALVALISKVGLEFGIVYEDQTLKDGLDNTQRISQAALDMSYLQNTFFKSKSYIRVNDAPLLLIFGPQIIVKPENWTNVFSALSPKPTFLTLYGHSDNVANNVANQNAKGEYIWVDGTSMETKYNNIKHFPVSMGAAYPGFNDYYVDGGWGTSPLHAIDTENGALFSRLLDMAKTNNVNYLQLITWNDFGEGTMIEPTQEFGYTFLEKVQTFTGTSTRLNQLQKIYQLYNLRKQFKGDTSRQQKLSQVFYYFVSMQDEKAISLLDELK